MSEPCGRCGNRIMPTRMGIGNGITVSECCICGDQNYIFQVYMKQRTGPAQGCEYPGYEDATDTDNGKYCALHRNLLRKEGRRLKAWKRNSVDADF